ncbi:acetyltransferase [Vibrio cholerae]|nr:acetyltransferase [Vibrio cholerae]MBO1390662.1 acetyltransferase [Vibrio cholerae]MBO1398119.1 acetyltransferase [Vibrio cholerae]
MVMVVVFEFSVMRCQPLRRALGFSEVKCISLYGIHQQ